MGLWQSASAPTHPIPISHTIFPRQQYLLPIFGHPSDVGSLSIMGSFSSTDTHIFGTHLLFPASTPLCNDMTNEEWWNRFGFYDFDLDLFRKHLAENKPLFPITRWEYGTGETHDDVVGSTMECLQALVAWREIEEAGTNHQYYEKGSESDQKCHIYHGYLSTFRNRHGQPYWEFERPNRSEPTTVLDALRSLPSLINNGYESTNYRPSKTYHGWPSLLAYPLQW